MADENSNAVKREKVEEEDVDDKSIASASANKQRKTPRSSSDAPAKSQARVKKEVSKVKKEESVEDSEEPSSKTKVQLKKKVKEEVSVETIKKGGKENVAKDANKRERKVYDLPGQKRDPPEERDPLRIFYETLYQQLPTSEMAAIWMMESGLLAKEEARKVFERKQKKSQQQRLSSPMKTVVNVNQQGDSVTIQKKSLAPVKKGPENKTELAKKRKTKSVDDGNDGGGDGFAADAIKGKKQRAS